MIRLRADDVVWRSIDGEIVVLDIRESLYLSLKGSGALLWPLLADGTSKETMSAALVARYGIDEVRAQQDVDAFLVGLEKRGLLLA